jgi:hypothetical protein
LGFASILKLIPDQELANLRWQTMVSLVLVTFQFDHPGNLNRICPVKPSYLPGAICDV